MGFFKNLFIIIIYLGVLLLLGFFLVYIFLSFVGFCLGGFGSDGGFGVFPYKLRPS